MDPLAPPNTGFGTLRLDSPKLYGRSREVSLLHEAYRRISAAPTLTDDDRSPNAGSASVEVVLVSGLAGCGKTSLVRQLEKDRGKSGWFVSGKFDQLRRSEPYSAVATAFDCLFRHILNDGDALCRMRKSLSEALPAEDDSTFVLAGLIPTLWDIIGDDRRYDRRGERKLSFTSSNGSNGRNRFNAAFCSLLRAVCSLDKPVVIFLDDTQWADLASLDLITALLTDTEATKSMYIVSYRDDEVGSTHPLTDRLQKVKDNVMQTTEIHVDNLAFEAINALVSDVTRLDPPETYSLTEMVINRTNANIFFVLQFLESLHHEGLLAYSLASFKWTWDIDTIASSTVICDNVVDLVLGKLRRLPDQVQEFLKVASCMGCYFDAELLEQALSEQCGISETADKRSTFNCDVKYSLNVAVREALIEKVGDGDMYKFSHDRVQQAAYSMFENDQDKELLHLCLGRSMQNRQQEQNGEDRNGEWMSYAIVDQMNLGSSHISSISERASLSEMNRRAGEKAALSSAFFPAASYLHKGIQLIQHDRMWNDQYDLSLGLHRKLALVEYACGNVADSKQSANLVIANARNIDDKLGAYFTLFKVLCYNDNTPEKGLSVGIACLRELGEKMDRNPSRPAVLADHLKVKRMLRGHSERSLVELPLIQSERTEAAMKMIMLMTPCSLALLRSNLYASITLRVLQLSLQHGVCAITAIGYANYGSLLCRRGDFNEADKFGRVALSLEARLDDEDWRGPVVYCVYGLIYHWRQPIQHSLDPLLQEYESSLLRGDVNLAFTSLTAYCAHYLNSGLPLGPLESDMAAYCFQMSEYNQKSAPLMALPMRQFILNLLGKSENPLVLTGTAMDYEDVMNEAQKVSMKSVATIHFLRLQLSFYFDDLHGCQELLPTTRVLAKKMRDAVFDMCRFVFFDGLASLALAQRGAGQGKWRRSGKRAMEKMGRWVKSGAVNVLHMLLILKAEYAVLVQKSDIKVKKAFDSAISTAGRSGFVQDKALAAERAGLYFLRLEDTDRASYYLSSAHSGYLSWGAQAKADFLLSKHAELLKEVKPSAEPQIGHRGRSRFSSTASNKHKELSFSGLAADLKSSSIRPSL